MPHKTSHRIADRIFYNSPGATVAKPYAPELCWDDWIIALHVAIYNAKVCPNHPFYLCQFIHQKEIAHHHAGQRMQKTYITSERVAHT